MIGEARRVPSPRQAPPRGAQLDLARGVSEAQEALRSLEVAALTEVAAQLAGAASDLALAAKDLKESQPPLWMDAGTAATRYGYPSGDAFEKAARKEGAPKHYFGERKPLYNREEIDAWLMGR